MALRTSSILGLLLAAVLHIEPAHAAASKTITLNNNANQAVLEDDGITTNRLVRIRSLNNSFTTVTFELPTSELIINLGGGDDTLSVSGTGITGFTAKLTINGGAGNDTTTVEQLISTQGVCWNDTVGTSQGLNIRSCKLTGSIQISDGDGAGGLGLDSSQVGPVSFTSTNGNAGFFIYHSRINGKLNIQNKGNGTDTIRFDGCSVSDDAYLDMGNGPVETQGLFSTFEGNFSLLAGSGAFTTTFGDSGFYKSFFQDFLEGSTDTKFYVVSVNGYADIQSGLGFDQLLLANVYAGIVNIHNGDGGSKVSTLSESFTGVAFNISSLNITNGEGADTFTTKGPRASTRAGHIGSLEINNGIGNSVTEITDPLTEVEYVHVAAGTGYDILKFGDTRIGTIIADLHDGGSSTTFDRTLVEGIDPNLGGPTFGGGMFAFYGGAGNDQILLDGAATYYGPVYIDLAGGTDLVDIATESTNPFFGPLVIDGGAGNDTIINPPVPQSFPGYLEIMNFELAL